MQLVVGGNPVEPLDDVHVLGPANHPPFSKRKATDYDESHFRLRQAVEDQLSSAARCIEVLWQDGGMDRLGCALGLITGRLRRRAAAHFVGLTLRRESDANSFGVESAGVWQVRGNGSLALTRHELLFAQWVPNRLLRIPRGSIVEVTTVRSHLGKTIRRDLLKVVWSTDLGTRDSIALWVGDLDGWLEGLESAAADS